MKRSCIVNIKGQDGVYVRGKEELKGVWKSHTEWLMNCINV